MAMARVVRGQTTAIPEAYRQIVVQTSAGHILLHITDESFYYLVTTAGTKPPILLVGSPSGNWLGVEAFMYSPAIGRMTRLQWDHENYVRGRGVQVDSATGAIRMMTEKGVVTYRLEQGVLREQR